MLETWQHWFASDAIGIIAVAPLVIGFASVVRRAVSTERSHRRHVSACGACHPIFQKTAKASTVIV